jgi:hypothetical protein
LSRCAAILVVAGLAAGCSSNQRPQEDTAVLRPGPKSQYDPARDESVFGDGGVSIGTLNSARTGGILGEPEQGSLPVNKYLWQASLDTLSFLPLASTDPFTGVIATDWGATPEAPSERFKVTAFIVSPVLSAASLKVAVYREARNADGLWLPAQVSPETARKLEDAILTRARQIRISDLGEGSTG